MRWRIAVAISVAVNMKPPSPEIATTGTSRPRVLRAERGGKTPAEIVLIARRDVGARLVDREGEARGKADLGDLVDENAVLRQFGADRVEEGDLRREFWRGACATPPGAPRISAVREARLALCAGSSSSRRCRIGAASPVSATAGLCSRSCSSGSASTRTIVELAVDAPLPELDEQARADREHHVGLAPQIAAERQRDAQRIAAVEHAAAAPIGEHRRLQQCATARSLPRKHPARRRRRRSAAAWPRQGALPPCGSRRRRSGGRRPAAALAATTGAGACPRRRWRIRAPPVRAGRCASRASPGRQPRRLVAACGSAPNDRPAAR